MKVPDFSQSIEFIRLRQQMGAVSIPALPPVKFERITRKRRVVEEVDKKDKRLLKKLGSGISVTASDLPVQKGFLTYGGRKVLAYIRDQRKRIDEYRKTSDYRFHLWDCATMRSMRRSGRERRYVATQRSDGWFEVNYPTEWGSSLRNATARLALCQHCRYELARRGLYDKPFSLKKYFQQHDSGVPRTVRRIETVEEVQEYRPNQAELSETYRETADYRCQLCKVDCRGRPGLLQLHHEDGDTSNNAHHNLRVLCVDCHSHEPYHGQMGRSASDQERITQIRKLRRQQNLFTLTPPFH